jgi:hypothetical protein
VVLKDFNNSNKILFKGNMICLLASTFVALVVLISFPLRAAPYQCLDLDLCVAYPNCSHGCLGDIDFHDSLAHNGGNSSQMCRDKPTLKDVYLSAFGCVWQNCSNKADAQEAWDDWTVHCATEGYIMATSLVPPGYTLNCKSK